MDRSLESQIEYTRADIEHLRSGIDTFGFEFLPDAITPSSLGALQDEVRERFDLALVAEQAAGLSYRANVVSLGPKAKELLRGQETIDLLYSVFGERFLLTEDCSCLTYYKEGDHLGPHLDKPESKCSVTVIAYLIASGPSPRPFNTGLVLHVYGQEMEDICNPRLSIPTKAGALVIGRGSKYWHERPKLEKGEYVAALTGCYGRISHGD